MGGQIELFKVSGIPVTMDFSFLLIAFLYTQSFWTAGTPQMMSAGLLMAVGLFASILLHELGHAWMGRAFKVDSRLIELNGLGGLCHFDRSLPASVLQRTLVYLAGPFANLVLWQAFKALSVSTTVAGAAFTGNRLPAVVLSSLAGLNFLLLVFNLLPAFPLDGGRVLEAWLTRVIGPTWGVRIVAGLGLLVVAWLVYRALPNNIWMLFVALSLLFANYQAWQSTTR
jgi:Zn-dependent protease